MGAEGTSERRLKLRAQAGTSDSYSQSALPCGIASQSHDRVSHPVTQPSFLSGTGGSVRNKAQFLLSRSLQSSGIALHRDSWGGKGPFSCYALTGVPAALPSGRPTMEDTLCRGCAHHSLKGALPSLGSFWFQELFSASKGVSLSSCPRTEKQQQRGTRMGGSKLSSAC